MADDREQQVKARAYEIWENEGRPSGRHDDHWDRARREIEDQDQGRATAAQAPAPEGPAKRAAARRKAGGDTAPKGRGRARSGIEAGARPPARED